MAYKTSVKIQIGGLLREAKLPEFVSAVEADGVDWGATDPDESLEKHLRYLAARGRVFQVEAHEVLNGSLDLESVCANLELTFDRIAFPNEGQDGYREYYAPLEPVADYRTWRTDALGNPTITGEELLSDLAANAFPSTAELRQALRKVLADLRVPSVPPLVLVD